MNKEPLKGCLNLCVLVLALWLIFTVFISTVCIYINSFVPISFIAQSAGAVEYTDCFSAEG